MKPQQKWMIDEQGALYLLPNIPNNSINLILTDLPYGTTACSWDTPIDMKQLWKEYIRIIKYTGSIVLFASQPFSSVLIMSNLSMFKYTWVWKKSNSTSFFHSHNAPLKKHEDICVFSMGAITHKPDIKRMVYNPQNLKLFNKSIRGDTKKGKNDEHKFNRTSRPTHYIQEYTNYPSSILDFNQTSKIIHPTQKPLKLIEYLIKTYSKKGEWIHDSCLGSGTTLKACKNLNRNCIGFEISNEWEWNYYKQLKIKKLQTSLNNY